MVLGELCREKSPLIKLTRRRFPLVQPPCIYQCLFYTLFNKNKAGQNIVLKTIHNKQIYVRILQS